MSYLTKANKTLSLTLQANFENYKPLFNTTLDDAEYFQMISHFANDTTMISAYKAVKNVTLV